MARLGLELGRTVQRSLARVPLAQRVRLGVGGAISAVGLVTLAAQAASVVGS
jgi:uncharacterized membrane protein